MKDDDFSYQKHDKILRYTTYQISKLVSEKLASISDIEKYAAEIGVESDLIRALSKPCKVYSVQMYMAASKITGKTYEELTAVDEVNIEQKFRMNRKGNEDSDKASMDLAYFLFKEIINNAKLSGE